MTKLLIKNRLYGLICGMAGKNSKGSKPVSPAKIVLFTLLYLYVFGAFLFLSITMSVSFGLMLIPAGSSWLYFAIFSLVTLSILFIFSIFETKSELFECKDNDLLLSMPIKSGSIVLSRIIVVLILNYVEEAIIMLPCIVVYGIMSRDAVGIIGALLVSLILPLLSTALASGVGYLVALISRKLRNKTLITVLLSLLFLGAYMLGYTKLIDGMDSFLSSGEALEILPSDLPLLYAIGSVSLLKPINFVVFAVLSLGISVGAYAVISKSYTRIVTSNKGQSRAVYKGKRIEKNGVLSALVRREFSGFFNSATYILNGALGVVFEIILAVVAVVKRAELNSAIEMIAQDMQIPITADYFSPVMITALILLSSMNIMTASAVSLEGKYFAISKTLPVKSRTVLISKLIPQLVITIPATLISSVLLMIAVSASVKYWAFFILTPLLANVFFAVLVLVINVAVPKFNYTSEAQVIKQSLSVFLVSIIQMLLPVALIVFNTFMTFIGLGLYAVILTFALFLGLSIGFFVILLGPSAKKYDTFEPL